MKKLISKDFFDRPTLKVAEALIGKNILCKMKSTTLSLPINEVEAYCGFNDKASHAHKGLTKRNQIMFGPAGFFYVYLCYGIHWMLNIVTEKQNYPAAILIRGAGEFDGPGKLTKKLKIDGSFNKLPINPNSGLWIEEGISIPKKKIKQTPRIGIGYAGEVWTKKKYRFIWDGST